MNSMKDLTFENFIRRPAEMLVGDYVVEQSLVVPENFRQGFKEMAATYDTWVMMTRHAVYATRTMEDNLVIERIPSNKIDYDNPGHWRAQSTNWDLYRWFYDRYAGGNRREAFYNSETGEFANARDLMLHFLSSHNGNDVAAISRFIDETMVRCYITLTEYGERYGKVPRIWTESNDVGMFRRFGGNITGTRDKDVEINSNDITVNVNLRTFPYDDQLKFVRDNVDNIVAYAIDAVRAGKTKKMKKAAEILGSLEFFYPSSIVLTRSSYVEIIFSPKPGIEKVLGS